MNSLYMIYDNVAEQFLGMAYPSRSPNAAIRQFADVIRDPQSQLHSHASDFVLVRVATLPEGMVVLADDTIVATGASFIAEVTRES